MESKIETLLNDTWAWHGTGRFQYDSNGQIVDTLELILKSDGLIPLVKDPWLRIEGNFQKSISLAKIRMYSRIYASTMQFDPNEVSYYYKSSKFWFWIIGIEHVFEKPFSIISHLVRLQFKKKSSSQIDDLISKYRKRDNIRKRPFLFKLMNMPSTDIPSNYGVIIGVSDCSEISFEMDKRYSLFEYRIRSKIPLEKFVYIEVPKSSIRETQVLLDKFKLTIPLFATEDIERFYAKKGIRFALKKNSN